MTAECVGCGYCCRLTACHFSMQRHGGHAPCKELVWDEKGQNWRCGLMAKVSPEERQLMIDSMGIGAGCSSSLFNFSRDEMIRKRSSRSSSSESSSCGRQAIGAAGSRMGLSKEVQEKYIRNVLKHAGKGWPKGFM
jgi:hypothetical protein